MRIEQTDQMYSAFKAGSLQAATALIVTVLAGCSSGKVEISKTQRVLPPPVLEISGDSGDPLIQSPAAPAVELKTVTPQENWSMAQTWQTWKLENEVRSSQSSLLTPYERALWASTVDSTQVRQPDELAVRLVGAPESLRCVFRNRMLTHPAIGQNVQGLKPLKLPAPMGAQDLVCVKRDHIREGGLTAPSQVTIGINRFKTRGALRWLGTTAAKAMAPSGAARVEMKVSQILGERQGFGRALKEALPDGMDQLMGLRSVEDRTRSCGLVRSAYLVLDTQNEQVLSGKLYIHTRMISARTQQKSQMIFTQSDWSDPQVDRAQIEDCAPIKAAWAQCLSDSRNCSQAGVRLLKENFGALLDARPAGFQSERVFTIQRKEANGAGRDGARSLLIWKDLDRASALAPSGIGGPDEPNPLSVEDFQEFVDVIDLFP